MAVTKNNVCIGTCSETGNDSIQRYNVLIKDVGRVTHSINIMDIGCMSSSSLRGLILISLI